MNLDRQTRPLCRLVTILTIVSSVLLTKSALANAQEADRQNNNQGTEVFAELRQMREAIKQLQQTVGKQQQQIDALQTENNSLKEESQAQAEETARLASSSSVASSARGQSALNPEIGVVADVVANSSESKEDSEGNDKISVRELELVLGHEIDPYSRLDTTIVFSDFEDVAIEEAYVTHSGIPEVVARLGRMRQKLGFATSVHRDRLDTVDEPIVVQRYLGVEGLFRTGLELSNFLPTPWESVSHEIIAGFMEGGVGEDGELLGDVQREPSFYASLRNFWEISDSTNLTLNGTWLTGSAGDGSSTDVQLYGGHLMLVHNFNQIHRLKLQSEAYFQDRKRPFSEEDGEDESDQMLSAEDSELLNKNPYGYYMLADYRFDPNWALGARFDWVEATNRIDGQRENDTAYTAYLTFKQSEFARWRTQYQHIDLADGGNDDQFWLQGTFAIGVHKHQLQ